MSTVRGCGASAGTDTSTSYQRSSLLHITNQHRKLWSANCLMEQCRHPSRHFALFYSYYITAIKLQNKKRLKNVFRALDRVVPPLVYMSAHVFWPPVCDCLNGTNSEVLLIHTSDILSLDYGTFWRKTVSLVRNHWIDSTTGSFLSISLHDPEV